MPFPDDIVSAFRKRNVDADECSQHMTPVHVMRGWLCFKVLCVLFVLLECGCAVLWKGTTVTMQLN